MTSDSSKRTAPSSVARKISKGVIERKRRARINRSLSELKFIILNDTTDKAAHSKLDKAEILERTLTYVQSLQTPSAADCLAKYREGFFSCMREVDRFLTMEKVDEMSRQKVTNYLAFCSTGLDVVALQQQTNNGQSAPNSPLDYSVTSHSPAPSMASSSGSDYSSADSKSESVWRPW